jgi:hypothetical protein
LNQVTQRKSVILICSKLSLETSFLRVIRLVVFASMTVIKAGIETFIARLNNIHISLFLGEIEVCKQVLKVEDEC